MAETLARLFRHTISFSKPDAILTKQSGEYRPISAGELYRRVGRLHFELKKAGIEHGDRLALLSENRWEWAVADFAMMTAGLVNVPIYPTLTAEQIEYLLQHSQCKAAMVSNQDQLAKIQQIWEKLPTLQGVIAFDEVEADDERIVHIGQLIGNDSLSAEQTAAFEASISAVEPADLASLIYTSGTTGAPKGVMLTHGSLSASARDCPIEIFASDVCLSFLPLCHVAERVADYVYFLNGATVAYAESLETVPDNMREVQPTATIGVPRFFEKVHEKVMAAIDAAPPIRQKLFHWAVGVGTRATPYLIRGEEPPLGIRLQRALADKIVLSKLRARLGGRFRMLFSGAAPLGKRLAEFFHAAGLPIYEAYGLTETSALVSANTPGSIKLGTVGKPIRGLEVLIADDGEILVKGPVVMRGYYKEPEKTAEVINDGWFSTGDIGEIDDDGFLKITDRKKDLFKTSGGKYIAPQPIENELKASPYISTAIVVAEKRKFPSVMVVPDFDRLRKYGAEQGLSLDSVEKLCAEAKVTQLIQAEVDRICKHLPRYEQPKKVLILHRELTIADGELTPTMKVRRRAVEERYADRIEALYSS